MNKKLLIILVGLLFVFVLKESVWDGTVEWYASARDRRNQERRDTCKEIMCGLAGEYGALGSEPIHQGIESCEHLQKMVRTWEKDGSAASKKKVLSALHDWVIVRDEIVETIREKGDEPGLG